MIPFNNSIQKGSFMNFLKICALVFFLGGSCRASLDISLPELKLKASTTVAINNCIIPMKGVTIPCEIDAEENMIKINTLQCSQKAQPFYCVRCLERIPIDITRGSRTKECKIFNFAGTEIQPKK